MHKIPIRWNRNISLRHPAELSRGLTVANMFQTKLHQHKVVAKINFWIYTKTKSLNQNDIVFNRSNVIIIILPLSIQCHSIHSQKYFLLLTIKPNNKNYNSEKIIISSKQSPSYLNFISVSRSFQVWFDRRAIYSVGTKWIPVITLLFSVNLIRHNLKYMFA